MDRHTATIRLLVASLLVTACTTGPGAPTGQSTSTDQPTSATPVDADDPTATVDESTSQFVESGLRAHLPRGTWSDRLIWVDAHRIHRLHWYVPQPE